jgi:hypothetical protein
MKVVSLETNTDKFKTEVQESIIKVLEENLKMARDGELTGVVVLATTHAEDTHSSWSKQTDNHLILAAVTRAMVRMVTG